MTTDLQVLLAVGAGVMLLAAALRFAGPSAPSLSDLKAFMRIRKKWWLGPIIMMLALIALLLVLTQGGAGGAFVYSLF